MAPTLAQLADALATGETTARALVEDCLARIADPDGQGKVVFVSVDGEKALAAADAVDGLRRAGVTVPRLAGIPVSIKDLFDVAGEPSRAGSVMTASPARADAPAVARLRAAGLIPIGRTNMTEFAFSGLGLNPHYGNPLAGWGRVEGRISGGSTSGGAASVLDRMAHAALGTDTGGSCRIPAAWCGLVGLKPTQRRVPRGGAIPLSTSFDSVGPIARSVACVRALDSLLSGESIAAGLVSLRGLRLAVPTNFVLEGIEPAVATAFDTVLDRLRAAGALVDPVEMPWLDRIPAINAKGGFAAAEAWTYHRRLGLDEQRYDPRVWARIRRGAEQDAADYVDLLAARAALIAEAATQLSGYDAMLCPTTPILPPRLADLVEDADYGRINLLALRNPSVINMIDGCAVSVPIHAEGAPPVGLMISGLAGADQRVLAIAQAVEGAFPSL